MNNIISSLKNGAAGWDEFTPQMIKEIRSSINSPLVHICNLSLQQGLFPDELEIANVLPLFKAVGYRHMLVRFVVRESPRHASDVLLERANWRDMLCTAQLGGPVLKASGRVQFSPFQLADKSPMITDQHTAGGSVSQLSQLTKLSPWLALSTKDIATSFWHYNKWFWFLSNQIMGLYHFSKPIEFNLCIYVEK